MKNVTYAITTHSWRTDGLDSLIFYVAGDLHAAWRRWSSTTFSDCSTLVPVSKAISKMDFRNRLNDDVTHAGVLTPVGAFTPCRR